LIVINKTVRRETDVGLVNLTAYRNVIVLKDLPKEILNERLFDLVELFQENM
jgi:hypothetical protein